MRRGGRVLPSLLEKVSLTGTAVGNQISPLTRNSLPDELDRSLEIPQFKNV